MKPFGGLPGISLTSQVRVESTLASLSPEELVLACRQTDDVAAWREFVGRFHRLIATVALRVARRWGESSPQLIDDLVQETYLKLCDDNFRMLRKFKSDHPDAFYGYPIHRLEYQGSGEQSPPADAAFAIMLGLNEFIPQCRCIKRRGG